MNRRYKRKRYKKGNINLKQVIYNHIEKNFRNYIIISLIFLIGVLIGVIYINNISENQNNEINEYINLYINDLKGDSINDQILLKTSLRKNLLLILALWFAGSTVIGISIVYLAILIRGFCLGYTISVFIHFLGTWKGTGFVMSAIVLQNILFIPAIIIIGVSGMNLYNSIMKNRRKENIKVEILRHTFILLLSQTLVISSSLIEVFISKNLLHIFIKYI